MAINSHRKLEIYRQSISDKEFARMYRAGIIGLGRIASTIDDEVQGNPTVMLPYSHMACYRAVPEVEVVAGADPYAEQREHFRQRWGVNDVYADYREMLERERLDIVSVTTTAKPRPEIVMNCARAGVRLIYAEKPLALSLADADRMLTVCNEHGTKLAVGCTRRWDPFWSTTRDLIRNGAIGRVLQVNGYGQCGISHNGSHLIDLVRFLAGGNVVWVAGESESDDAAQGENDHMVNGYLAFDNGVRAYIRTWPSGAADWQFEVIGETGRFRSVGRGSEIEWWQKLPNDPFGTLVRRPLPRPQRIESPGVRAVRDFIQCLESEKQPECSGEDGRAALEIALALRESHRRGNCRVNLPLADRSLVMHSADALMGDVPAALRPR